MEQIVDSLLSVFEVTSVELMDAIITILSIALPVACTVYVVKIGILVFKHFTR